MKELTRDEYDDLIILLSNVKLFNIDEYCAVASEEDGHKYNKFGFEIFDEPIPKADKVPDGIYDKTFQVYNNMDYALNDPDDKPSRIELADKIQEELDMQEESEGLATELGDKVKSKSAFSISNDADTDVDGELHEFLKQFA